jgi:hypothetical protein
MRPRRSRDGRIEEIKMKELMQKCIGKDDQTKRDQRKGLKSDIQELVPLRANQEFAGG